MRRVGHGQCCGSDEKNCDDDKNTASHHRSSLDCGCHHPPDTTQDRSVARRRDDASIVNGHLKTLSLPFAASAPTPLRKNTGQRVREPIHTIFSWRRVTRGGRYRASQCPIGLERGPSSLGHFEVWTPTHQRRSTPIRNDGAATARCRAPWRYSLLQRLGPRDGARRSVRRDPRP